MRGSLFSLPFLFWFGQGGMMRESTYQAGLIKRIETLIPGCVVLKNDPREIQGIPDLLVLYKDKWGMLEIKVSSKSKRQPNQMYYIETLGEMSFAAFIHPENEEEVLHGLTRALGSN
jgi:hypothetical protein